MELFIRSFVYPTFIFVITLIKLLVVELLQDILLSNLILPWDCSKVGNIWYLKQNTILIFISNQWINRHPILIAKLSSAQSNSNSVGWSEIGKIPTYRRMEVKWAKPWPSKSGYSCTIHCPFQPPGYGGSQVACKLPWNSLNQWWRAPRQGQKSYWPLEKWKVYAPITEECQYQHVLPQFSSNAPVLT